MNSAYKNRAMYFSSVSLSPTEQIGGKPELESSVNQVCTYKHI